MVCVWPPQTSMNLYSRPGSHNSAIRADSACALSASRYSSTKRIGGLLFDGGCLQCSELLGVGVANVFQELQRRHRLGFVYFGQSEADVNQDPVTRLDILFLEQADVDGPTHTAHIHAGEIRLIGQDRQHLTGNTQAHTLLTPVRGSVR